VLGDIPLLGNLFRQQTRRKVKTNLLLFLTPYIIREGSDFRRIFERKMKERQEFVEQFYGASTQYDVAIDFQRKPGPLARVTQVLNREMNKLENGGPGEGGAKLIVPGAGSTPGVANPPAPSGTPESAPAVPVKEPSPETLKVQPEIN
jgi:general secretion pathway protein D